MPALGVSESVQSEGNVGSHTLVVVILMRTFPVKHSVYLDNICV